MFYLAILLGPPSEPQEKVWTPDLVLQVPLLALYYSLVLYLPSADNASDTGVFISMIVLIRLLLFAPLYLPLLVPNRFQIKDSTAREKFSTYVRAAWFVLLIITSLVLFETAMAPKENNFRVWNVVTAINENPAVSALGYDYVISMVSFAFWISPMGISKRNKLE